MKKNKTNNENKLSFAEFKNTIDNLILTKKISKLKRQENYFDICNNYWIVDTYIANNGQINIDATPNTLKSYTACIENNYTISIPVQILDDGNVVCFSHKNISKVVSTASGYLNNLSLEELKSINLNEDEDKVPTLEEALNHIAGRTPIIIEIINEGMIGKLEDKILSLIKNYIEKYDCYNLVAIMSINPYTLQYCFQEFPYITRILKSGLFTEKTYGTLSTNKLRKLKYYKITNSDFISYSHSLLPYYKIMTKKPVGIIANSVTNQNQYIDVAPFCDNIIFNSFTPTI